MMLLFDSCREYVVKIDLKILSLQKRENMDYDLTLYQVSPRLAETVIARIGEFNRGRTTVNGCYAISVATAYRPYYAFWRFFPT